MYHDGTTVDAIECEEGTYQDEKGQLTCKACLPGKYGKSKGLNSSDCSGFCPPGTRSLIRAKKCTPCEAGKFNPLEGKSF